MEFKNIYNHTLWSQNEIENIKSNHSKINLKKGQVLLKEGQVSKEYYCIESGILRAYVFDYNGKEITTCFFSENEIAIEPSSLFLSVPSKENIVAITDCICWKINFEDFQNLFHSVPNFSDWGRQWMTIELLNSRQRSLSLLTDSAKERYLRLLKSKPHIIKYSPLKYIASYLGITDSTLSKIRKQSSSF